MPHSNSSAQPSSPVLCIGCTTTHGKSRVVVRPLCYLFVFVLAVLLYVLLVQQVGFTSDLLHANEHPSKELYRSARVANEHSTAGISPLFPNLAMGLRSTEVSGNGPADHASTTDAEGAQSNEKEAALVIVVDNAADNKGTDNNEKDTTKTSFKTNQEAVAPTTTIAEAPPAVNAVAADANLTAAVSSAAPSNTVVVWQSEDDQLPFGLPLTSELNHIFHAKHLILGLAANTDLKNLAIFVGSVSSAVPLGTVSVVLFVNTPVPTAHVDFLRDFPHIHIIPYREETLTPSFLRNYHPSSIRWIFYHRLLNMKVKLESAGVITEVWQHFNKILAVDVRDTAFQYDPFPLVEVEGEDAGSTDAADRSGGKPGHLRQGSSVEAPAAARPSDEDNILQSYASMRRSSLQVFGEDPYSSIARCGWNSGWVQDCFGEEVLRAVGNQPVVCSGISLGPTAYMKTYFQHMHDVLLGSSQLFHTSKFPSCERNGVDQGVHNVLIHMGKLAPLTVQYPQQYPVINMQSAPDITPDPTRNNLLYVPNGDKKLPFAIVHQYDRNADLQLSLANKYIRWIPWANPVQEWAENKACTSFDKRVNADLFRGRCDVGSVRIMTAASCCDSCQQRNTLLQYPAGGARSSKHCTGFTFVGGVCYLKSCDKEEVRSAVRVFDSRRDGNMAEKDAVSAFLKLG